uniref:Uncharacterized protein n=1 Tax=Panagrolaimus sp. ES5 TaxID=591445 RepID=A0AC34FQ15_9BILA
MKPQQSYNNDKNFNENDEKYSLHEKFYPESHRSTLDEEIQQHRIQELEQYKYQAQIFLEKVESEKRIEKERADAAEKEVEELQNHIFHLNALEKEKDVEFDEYKNAAEYYISKCDNEKEQAIQWIENNQKELGKLQTTVNYLHRELEDEKYKAIKKEQKKQEEIKRSEVQRQRLVESLKNFEEKNDKLDLEAMKCRKNVANVEEQLNRSLKQLKSSLSAQLPDQNPHRTIPICHARQFSQICFGTQPAGTRLRQPICHTITRKLYN